MFVSGYMRMSTFKKRRELCSTHPFNFIPPILVNNCQQNVKKNALP